MAKLSLVISVVALGLAAFALSKAPGSPPSPASGMGAYDFSTPEAAWHAGREMERAQDLQAMMEFTLAARKEQLETAKLEDSAPFGERWILFVSHQEDGKKKYVTRGMKKAHGTELWVSEYIPDYEVRKEDEELAARMEAWEEQSE